MKGITKEVQIALVAIVGVVILFFGLNFLKGLSFFTTEDTYYVEFDDISGLNVTASVYADGYKVGSVSAINFNYGNGEKTITAISIDKQMRLPKGTKAEIESDMLGNIKINLLLANNPKERVNPGDTLTGEKNAGMMGKVAAMVPAIEKMLPKLDSIMGSLNTLLADPAMANSLHNIENVTGNLTTTTKELNTLMGTLNRDMPHLMASATSTMGNADKITKSLADADLANTVAQANATLANLNKMTENINSGKGTIGLLVNDPTLYHNLNSTMSSANSLLNDLKSHPKRYVHFSLFGKKDK